VTQSKVTRPELRASRGTMLAKEYAPLPLTAHEAEAIANALPNVALHTGPDATKSTLESVANPMILHIATHGYYLNSTEPAPDRTSHQQLLKKEKYGYLRSGIILQSEKGADSQSENRIMTALELAMLDLQNTDLVVLSACDSGVGDTTPGDTVSGLRSAFQIAGAKAVVSSLWTVDDLKGEALMEAFYKSMAQAGGPHGESINKSLRQTKLAMLGQGQHPYYWASFVLDGVDQVLPIASSR
jgi:CHAT domain-containing protein